MNDWNENKGVYMLKDLPEGVLFRIITNDGVSKESYFITYKGKINYTNNYLCLKKESWDNKTHTYLEAFTFKSNILVLVGYSSAPIND